MNEIFRFTKFTFLFQHSMVYFFHHYELPVIMQQAQLQQLIIRSRQQTQQQQQQNNQRTTATTAAIQLQPSPIRRITLTNLNLPNTNQGNDNNNNRNILVTFGTYMRQNVRLLNIFRTIRNVLWNGIINPNLNNINTPRIRMINIRNNLRQINLGGIEIPSSNNVVVDSGTVNPVTDTRSTFERNYDENNFRVPEAENSDNQNVTAENTAINSVPTPNVMNDAADMPNESDARNEQTINKDEKSTATETKEMNANIDEYSFEIIESKHRNECNDPAKTVTPSQSDTSLMPGDCRTTTPNNNIDSVDVVAATTGIPHSQSNEMLNQTIPLEKMEIREDNRIDERKTYENLFTESSTEEICSSNKGDTGNCNGKGRGNEFVDGMEVERNVSENGSESDVKDNGATNCDFKDTASPK